MAEKKFADVWLVDSNTVYRDVPYNVVADWLQQSRLLPGDRVRLDPKGDWLEVGTVPEFAAYLPRAEPHRPTDQAESLEPVQVEFGWKHKREDEDSEVDMIPLIDVSLVLLIFFMMTSSPQAGSGKATQTDPVPAPPAAKAPAIPTPAAVHGFKVPSDLWIGVNLDGEGNPVFSLGAKGLAPGPGDADLKTAEDVLKRLDEKLAPATKVEVVVRAHKYVKWKVIRDLNAELARRSGPAGKINRKYFAVSEEQR